MYFCTRQTSQKTSNEPTDTNSSEFFVKTPGNTLTLVLNKGDMVEQIKKRIQSKVGIPCDQQCLVFAGKQLENGRTLRDYNIRKENTIHLLVRVCGGMHNGEDMKVVHHPIKM
jgi:hypothetical protein